MAESKSSLLPSSAHDVSAVQFAESDCAARWVVFEYCISFVAVSLRRPSRPYRLRHDQWGWLRGLPYTCISLLLGWWGLPWGVIYTPLTVFTNLAGGIDVTAQVREFDPQLQKIARGE